VDVVPDEFSLVNQPDKSVTNK